MRQEDTFIGGSGRVFPTTIWSDILQAGDPSHPRCRERLDQLLRTYWKPVYAYVRTAWKKSVDDAKDLTQAFFTHMINKGYFERVHPEKGSFRGYVKTALRHFLIDANRSESVRKPQGKLFSFDAAPGDFDKIGPAGPDEAPEQAYDREWFRGLMEAGVEELGASLKKEGKAVYFDAFRMYCIDPEPAITYRDVAEKLSIGEEDVRNYLKFCRAALRTLLRRRIRDYVAGDGDVESELQAVLGG